MKKFHGVQDCGDYWMGFMDAQLFPGWLQHYTQDMGIAFRMKRNIGIEDENQKRLRFLKGGKRKIGTLGIPEWRTKTKGKD